jgi:DNA-binding transcriptional ArsR family regulator
MNQEVVLCDSEACEVEAEERTRTKGYFRVDHQIFQDECLRRLSGEGFRIFLWMSSRAWRFPASKGFLRASISMIHLYTGVSEATVSRVLNELKKADLIQLHKVDRKVGNWWWVRPVFQIPQNESTQIKISQNEGLVPSKRGNGSLKVREKIPQNEGHIRSIKEEIKEEEESASSRLAWKTFKRSFSSEIERKERLKIMVTDEFTGTFKPPERVMESLVVLDWFLKMQKGGVVLV